MDRYLQDEDLPAPAEVPLLELSGPVLIFGGCYSNLEATRAIQAQAKRFGIPPERTICTGDVVAYCADASATVDLIRRWGVHVVMGNCEEAIGWSASDCGCGFAEGSACDQLSSAWYAHTNSHVDDNIRSWMRGLPRRIDIVVGGKRLAVVHGAVDSINRFIFLSTPWSEKRRQIESSGCTGIIGGHCGLPFTQVVDDMLWHNAGSIGMPANDGTSRVWYSLIVPVGDGIKVETASIEYDFASAAQKMRAARLPEGYAAALENGLWPSCDVLPAAELAMRGTSISPSKVIWNERFADSSNETRFDQSSCAKFQDSAFTAIGEHRAVVRLKALETLWFNTGTLCNLACSGCYIESSPKNDRLAFLDRDEVRQFLVQASQFDPPPSEIGFTGGEPFMNPHFLGMIEDCLMAGHRVLVLTNAMKPMQRQKMALEMLNARYPGKIAMRVSLDHYQASNHERLRGPNSWQATIEGLNWLATNGFDLAVAARMVWGESEAAMRAGFGELLRRLEIAIDADDPRRLVLFPEMDPAANVPEISESCWSILGKDPDDVMCARSRMIVKRKGAAHLAVVSCTLLPYDHAFELGSTLIEGARPIALNHRYCASFCVLGGGSCAPRT